MTTTAEQDRNLLEAAEGLLGYYCPCMRCQHYNEKGNNCSAFPGKIPDEIFFGENLHKAPYPGDHGILFESLD
jgi:hypothetical protein